MGQCPPTWRVILGVRFRSSIEVLRIAWNTNRTAATTRFRPWYSQMTWEERLPRIGDVGVNHGQQKALVNSIVLLVKYELPSSAAHGKIVGRHIP
jgi:hypothetical protein